MKVKSLYAEGIEAGGSKKMLARTYLLLPVSRRSMRECRPWTYSRPALIENAVVEDINDGPEMYLKSPLHRECLKRSIITRGGSCCGVGLGGEESLIEVEKRFRI